MGDHSGKNGNRPTSPIQKNRLKKKKGQPSKHQEAAGFWNKRWTILMVAMFNPLNAELNPIRHLLALVGARHIVHVSRVTVKQKV